MKALIRKDIYQIFAQFKIFIVLLLVFAAIPGGNTVAFAVIYSVLITSVSLMSVDEQSKWDTLALMLPYSRREIVMSKYVLGWMSLGASLVICALVQTLWTVTGVGAVMDREYISTLCLYAAVALLIQAVVSPVNFRFGFTKGRIVTLISVGAAAGIVAAFSVIATEEKISSLLSLMSHIHLTALPILLLTAALSLASIPLSVRGYLARCGK